MDHRDDPSVAENRQRLDRGGIHDGILDLPTAS